MRSSLLAKFSKGFLFLAIGFLMLCSPFSVKAQGVSEKCDWVWKWVWVWEPEPVTRYNGATNRYETYSELQYVYRYRYVYDCALVVTEPKSATSSSKNSINELVPSGEFEKVWVDHSVYENQKKGMRIHAKFDVRNLKAKECRVNAYFYYASGKPLKDFNDKFSTTNGNVAMHEEFTPSYKSSTFKDFQLFMPYSELDRAAGEYKLKFVLKLSCEGLGFLAESEDYEFSYSRPK
jgi:hypothetical protein